MHYIQPPLLHISAVDRHSQGETPNLKPNKASNVHVIVITAYQDIKYTSHFACVIKITNNIGRSH